MRIMLFQLLLASVLVTIFTPIAGAQPDCGDVLTCYDWTRETVERTSNEAEDEFWRIVESLPTPEEATQFAVDTVNKALADGAEELRKTGDRLEEAEAEVDQAREFVFDTICDVYGGDCEGLGGILP